MFFLLFSRITGEDGKEVIMEIEKNLPRLCKVLKVCDHFKIAFNLWGKKFLPVYSSKELGYYSTI